MGGLGGGTAAGPEPRHACRRLRLPAAAPPGGRLPKWPTAWGADPDAGCRRLSGDSGRRGRPSAVPASLFRPRLLGQLHRQPVPAALAPGPYPFNRGGGPVVHRGSRGCTGDDLCLAAATGLRAGSPRLPAGRPASTVAGGRGRRARGRPAAQVAGRPIRPSLPHDLRHRMRRSDPPRRRAGVGGSPYPGPAPRRRPNRHQPRPGAPTRVCAGGPRPGHRRSRAHDRLLAARLRPLRGRQGSAGG